MTNGAIMIGEVTPILFILVSFGLVRANRIDPIKSSVE